jgi:hypothetical protein
VCGYGVVLAEHSDCELHDVFRKKDLALPLSPDISPGKCKCSSGGQWILECIQDPAPDSSCHECTCATACITILDFIKFLETRSSTEDKHAACLETLLTLTSNPSLVSLCDPELLSVLLSVRARMRVLCSLFCVLFLWNVRSLFLDEH